jgi:hypothetical protein
MIAPLLLGLSLCAIAAAFFLRRRVPRRNTNESADLFWTTALAPALITWAPCEGAALLALFAYARTGQVVALGVAGIAVAIMVALNPVVLERR